MPVPVCLIPPAADMMTVRHWQQCALTVIIPSSALSRNRVVIITEPPRGGPTAPYFSGRVGVRAGGNSNLTNQIETQVACAYTRLGGHHEFSQEIMMTVIAPGTVTFLGSNYEVLPNGEELVLIT